MRAALYIAMGIGVMAAPVAAQQQGPDILTIWDQFSISNSVASKCVKPDEDKLAKFLVNFQIITTHASLRIKQLRPDWTPEQVDQAMKERYGKIDKSIAAIITQDTCDGPKVKEALRRFDVQAGIDFYGADKPK